MFNNLFLKTLHDKRGFMLGWSIGLAVMAGITIAFFPTIKDQMGELFANVPKALEGVTGSPDDYKNITGYVATGVFDLRIPMLTIVMAIVLALGVSSSEELSGRLYQLLAQPISRSKIVLQKWLAMLTIFAAAHLALLLGILLVIALIGESMALSSVFIGTFMCLLLTLAIGSITLAMGFATGRKGLTTMIVTSYVFGSYLLTSFAAQIEWLRHIEPISIFHFYKASEAIKGSYSLGNIAVLCGVAAATLLIGTFFFNKRDVGTHSA